MKKYYLPAAVFFFIFIILGLVNQMISPPVLILERFFPNYGGWAEIPVISYYGGLLAWKMRDPPKAPRWRKITWTMFSAVFFTQLLAGLFVSETFLMTGKLHLPVPAMIIAGPLYRWEIGFMTLLFISTVILSGPAWCSHLCYFGAMDYLSADRKNKPGRLNNLWTYKYTLLLFIIAGALLFRLVNLPSSYATLGGMIFGITGLVIIVLLSLKRGMMMHCTAYCPVGTLVSLVKKISPFGMRISSSCTLCMACTLACRYQALEVENIRSGQPGRTCTYCGDCLSSCPHHAIQYTFLKLKPGTARNAWLFITISLHAVFLALGRI
ncbi:MAG TPA: 4Fe-4S binding protein [Bacteroidetes bacterium]|nr:4Fe-4S binding protein [Bacteroidota bacterium]